MKNALFIFLLALVAVSFASFWLIRQFFSTENKETKKTTLTINGQELRVEIANSFLERQQGLSGRPTLAENEGMLFVFTSLSRPSFWMKEMNFPLDFIWLKDNQVMETTENVPHPQSATATPQIVKSSQPINKVLEVRAGTVERLKIKAGDKLTY